MQIIYKEQIYYKCNSRKSKRLIGMNKEICYNKDIHTSYIRDVNFKKHTGGLQMVYTVTLNPAVDYVIHTDDIIDGSTNRTKSEEVYIGGKGINVSLVLAELGITSKTLGFVAGFTGEYIENEIREKGIETDFVHLKSGFSRINVKIKSTGETEINGNGPVITENDVKSMFEKLSKLKDGDTIVLAGSVPNSLPNDIYERILDTLSDRKIRIIVDATKDLLLKSLKYKPFLIKPNKHELGEIFGVKLTSLDEIKTYATKLKDMGVQNVLVSMAGDGALLLDETGDTYFCEAYKGTVKNSVGAGDSMVAGFIAGLASGDYNYAIKMATAAGGATAFSDGLAKKDEIYRLLR